MDCCLLGGSAPRAREHTLLFEPMYGVILDSPFRMGHISLSIVKSQYLHTVVQRLDPDGRCRRPSLGLLNGLPWGFL